MKKKTMKKEIEKIKAVNDTVVDIVKAYADKYEFTEEDKKNVKNIETHLLNMNVLFSKLVEE